MRPHRHDAWTRRGFSLLWDPKSLAQLLGGICAWSLREFLTAAKNWPENLPHASGSAMVVVGLEGCIDALSEADAIEWIERDLKTTILNFQDHYSGGAALILWLPSGRKRIEMEPADDRYYWRRSAGRGDARIPIGRCLWGGAESDVERIVVSSDKEPDLDGPEWTGLHLPRIS